MTVRRSRAGTRLPEALTAAIVLILFLLGMAVVSSALRSHSATGADLSIGVAVGAQSQSYSESSVLNAAHPLSGKVNAVIATVNVTGGPTSLGATFDPTNGYVYFGSNGTNLTAINGASNLIQEQIFLGPYASPATPNYVGGAVNDLYAPVISTDPPPDNVSVISGSTDLVLKYLSTGSNSYPTTGVYDPANGYLYVPATGGVIKSHVTVINTATNTVQATIPVGGLPSTPAYDPADGYIYVPNTNSNNVTIINGSADTAVGSISVTLLNAPLVVEDYLTESPVYDPITHSVYQPDTGNVTLTQIQGSSFVRNFTVGPGPQTPAVDPLNGNLWVPIAFTSLATGSLNDTISIVNVTSNTVTNITVGESPETPVYDPANNEMYVACLAPHSNYGEVTAVNATTGNVVATITVGVSPVVPAFDSTNDELYVPDSVSNNVSVIGAGPVTQTSPPGTYPVTFAETGLPSGAWWDVTFNGTEVNESSPSAVFPSIPNGSYPYSIGPWADESRCTLPSSSASGSVAVRGAAVTVNLPFTCTGGSGGGGGSGSSTSFLGLPGDDGYFLLAGAAAAAVVAAVVGLRYVGQHRPPPGLGGSSPSPAAPPPPPPPPPPP
jgi:YVTN family beta-propeller protein